MSQAGGGLPPPAYRPNTIRTILVLPYTDLALADKAHPTYQLSDYWHQTLSLVYGFGPVEPRVLQLDDAGHVILSTAAGSIGQVRLEDGVGTALASVLAPLTGRAAAGAQGLQSVAEVLLFNGTNFEPLQSASAANINAQSGLGAALVSMPGTWAVNSNPAAGTQATASRAAGGAGVRHVSVSNDFGYGATTALAAAAQRLVNLRDGASGAGTILDQHGIPVPATTIPATTVPLSGRSVAGSAATAMTLEFDASTANLFESVALDGFDAT